jgi:two-component system phosphate regulon response regulator PhoB
MENTAVPAPENSRVLLVEDETDIAELISLHLKREGHQVTAVENGEEALRRLQGGAFGLLVLDWMLPGLSGLELCRKIRTSESVDGNQIPILMVTARAHSSDIVLGLELGADDYLTKPFEVPVLMARVRALLRRTHRSEREETTYQVGELYVNTESYRVTCGEREVPLTPSEFKLLVALLKNQGRVLTRERLIDLVQGEGVTVIDRAIDTHVFGLRKKLGRCSEAVETIRGVGYRIKF